MVSAVCVWRRVRVPRVGRADPARRRCGGTASGETVTVDAGAGAARATARPGTAQPSMLASANPTSPRPGPPRQAGVLRGRRQQRRRAREPCAGGDGPRAGPNVAAPAPRQSVPQRMGGALPHSDWRMGALRKGGGTCALLKPGRRTTAAPTGTRVASGNCSARRGCLLGRPRPSPSGPLAAFGGDSRGSRSCENQTCQSPTLPEAA